MRKETKKLLLYNMKKFIKRLIWRLQYKKVRIRINENVWNCDGRCVKCDAGNPNVECSEYGCPCNMDEHLKRVRKFNWL